MRGERGSHRAVELDPHRGARRASSGTSSDESAFDLRVKKGPLRACESAHPLENTTQRVRAEVGARVHVFGERGRHSNARLPNSRSWLPQHAFPAVHDGRNPRRVPEMGFRSRLDDVGSLRDCGPARRDPHPDHGRPVAGELLATIPKRIEDTAFGKPCFVDLALDLRRSPRAVVEDQVNVISSRRLRTQQSRCLRAPKKPYNIEFRKSAGDICFLESVKSVGNVFNSLEIKEKSRDVNGAHPHSNDFISLRLVADIKRGPCEEEPESSPGWVQMTRGPLATHDLREDLKGGSHDLHPVIGLGLRLKLSRRLHRLIRKCVEIGSGHHSQSGIRRGHRRFNVADQRVGETPASRQRELRGALLAGHGGRFYGCAHETIPRDTSAPLADGIFMIPDPAVPPLLFVPVPDHVDAIEALACPACWNVTAVRLGKPTAKCEVCEQRFATARGDV